MPGATHDSSVAELGGVYDKLERVFESTGAICTVDSAFRVKNAPYLFKSAQTFNREPIHDPEDEVAQREWDRMKQATSVRQTAEWGMGSLKSSFPRLMDTFLHETHGERKVIMKMMILLYNLRARIVGINQIRNFFNRELADDTDNLLA
jgi:hypothetical protein